MSDYEAKAHQEWLLANKENRNTIKMFKNINNEDINIFLIKALEGDQLEERAATFDVSSGEHS